MTLDDIPVFAMLKGRLSYLSDRQRLIAENVANASTPGFTPRDLKPFTLPGAGLTATAVSATPPTMTSPMHLAMPMTHSVTTASVAAKDSETTLSGNSVVLEEEMAKMSQSREDYQAAVEFYEQSINMLQTAIKRPVP
jgi:flagellar basal-body rod protein FlgB